MLNNTEGSAHSKLCSALSAQRNSSNTKKIRTAYICALDAKLKAVLVARNHHYQSIKILKFLTFKLDIIVLRLLLVFVDFALHKCLIITLRLIGT